MCLEAVVSHRVPSYTRILSVYTAQATGKGVAQDYITLQFHCRGSYKYCPYCHTTYLRGNAALVFASASIVVCNQGLIISILLLQESWQKNNWILSGHWTEEPVQVPWALLTFKLQLIGTTFSHKEHFNLECLFWRPTVHEYITTRNWDHTTRFSHMGRDRLENYNFILISCKWHRWLLHLELTSKSAHTPWVQYLDMVRHLITNLSLWLPILEWAFQ